MINYDVLISGARPPGLTAAIYCARKRLKTLVISKDISGKVKLTREEFDSLKQKIKSGQL